SDSSTESDTEANPPAKKAKLTVEPSRSESSDNSGSDSGSNAPVATTGPQQPGAINSRAESSSPDPSDSDSDSDSGSESESDAPVPQASVAVAQGLAARSSRASPSPSSSESSDSSDSDSDMPIPTAVLPKPQKSVTFKLPALSSSSDSDSDSNSDDESESKSDESNSSALNGPKLPKPLERSSVQQFFNQFPYFPYDSSESVMWEYHCLRRTEGFKSLSPQAQRKARRDLKVALTKDFGQLYGTDVNDLGALQTLCLVLGFEDVPNNLEKCQNLVTSTYVNVVNLIDTVYAGDLVVCFDSEKELSEYTIWSENFVSKNSQHAGSLLKCLLRNIYIHSSTDATAVNRKPLGALNRKRKRGT
ncbi:unnamed protein product, partial [Rhizoctonia solani]